MIGRLCGTLVEQGADGICVIDVGGVGYDVAIPLGALGRMGGLNEAVTVHVHTHVREDTLSLYGFASQSDRAAFRALLGVSSVGPKVALAIMGSFDAPGLAAVVAHGDVAALKAISGVGKKTAERLILDLGDKLPKIVPSSPEKASPSTPLSGAGAAGAAIGALANMGYRPAEAERAVQSLGEAAQDMSVEEILRSALVALSQ